MQLVNIFSIIGQIFAVFYADEATLDAGGQIPVKVQIGSRNGKPVHIVGNIVEG